MVQINGRVPPSAYAESYAKARLIEQEAADSYIAHTWIGDPVMDDLLEEIAPLPRHDVSAFIKAGMEQDHETLKKAPQVMRDFFDETLHPPPDWVDYEAFGPGIRSFQRNSPTILAAFVAGTLINGFTTLISKSFVQTGRIFDNGVWRLRQNNRHMIEIFWPGGWLCCKTP